MTVASVVGFVSLRRKQLWTSSELPSRQQTTPKNLVIVNIDATINSSPSFTNSHPHVAVLQLSLHDAMNATPRLRAGAFPSTPQNIPGQRPFASSESKPQRPRATIPSGPKFKRNPPPEPPQEPLISTEFLDAASQRLLVVTVYSLLWAWRLFDFYNLVFRSSNDSLWLFLKWIALDGVFLFSLPALRIPWLEPSSPALVAIYLAHVLLDSMIMFRIGVSLALGV